MRAIAHVPPNNFFSSQIFLFSPQLDCFRGVERCLYLPDKVFSEVLIILTLMFSALGQLVCVELEFSFSLVLEDQV